MEIFKGTPQTSQQAGYSAIPNYSLPQSFGELIILGQDLPPELEEYFFGFDYEMQLSKLPHTVIDYLNSSVNLINLLLKKMREIQNTDVGIIDVPEEWFKHEINRINVEVKEMVRGYRGVEGFTTVEMGTGRHIIQQEQTYEDQSRKKGLFKDRRKETLERRD